MRRQQREEQLAQARAIRSVDEDQYPATRELEQMRYALGPAGGFRILRIVRRGCG